MSGNTKELEGTWAMLRGKLAGEYAPEFIAQRTEIEFTASAYQVRFDGDVVDRGSFEVSGSTWCKHLVLRGDEGTNAGCVIPCIYQIARDRLRICYGLNGTTPTVFASSAGLQTYVVTYQRKHPSTVAHHIS